MAKRNGKATRGTSNGNSSGSAEDRRRRREWLWAQRAERGRITCHYCPRRLKRTEFEVDRLVCGHDGGTYARANIVPACPPCNRDKCAKQCGRGVTSEAYKAKRRAILAIRAALAAAPRFSRKVVS